MVRCHVGSSRVSPRRDHPRLAKIALQGAGEGAAQVTDPTPEERAEIDENLCLTKQALLRGPHPHNAHTHTHNTHTRVVPPDIWPLGKLSPQK